MEAAKSAGLVGERRVLDSTPLYDAVATMDTITLVRSAMRGLLKAADAGLEAELRAVIKSGDDYTSSAKPQIDWDDHAARDELISSRARDAHACLALLEGRPLGPEVAAAAELLASVLGQDLEATDDGSFRIARKVANDRVISTVDPEARHGHKTSARGFDGYKGHIALDPDSEIITATEVTAGNKGDAAAAPDLVEDLVSEAAKRPPHDSKGQPTPAGTDGGARSKRANKKANKPADHAARVTARGARRAAKLAARKPKEQQAHVNGTAPAVYGDAAYGAGGLLAYFDQNGIDARVKTAPPSALGGLFAKDRFVVDLEAGTVTCPAGNIVVISLWPSGVGAAHFGPACRGLPAAGSLHHGQRRADHYHFCSRRAHPGSAGALRRARFRRRLPRHPAQSRAKTRPPGQAAPRGQEGASARQAQSQC